MKIICFSTPHLCKRGSTVALFDYALNNQKILNNKSIIAYKKSRKNNSEVVNKFKKYFLDIFQFNTQEELDQILKKTQSEYLYTIKYGKNNGIYSTKVKTLVHCVFDLSEPHGHRYVAVSETLAKKFSKKLFVPHMITLKPSVHKENLRTELKIPKKAIVIGRYGGGSDTFNLNFVMDAIKEIVRSNTNIYFLLANTHVFDNHSQIIFYKKNIITDYDKNKFICTQDALLEAGTLGHSFGIECGENSINNKPVIAYNGNIWNHSHLSILKEKGIYFQNKEEFKSIILNFNPSRFKNKDNNCYKEYSPEKVMKIFEKVFL